MIDSRILQGADLPVYRTKPLPVGDLQGRFLVAAPLIDHTREALTTFALAGIRDAGHEGLVYWAGRELDDVRVLISVVVPRADHSAQRVMVSRGEVARASRTARSQGLGLLCQVHSHPGRDARHSDGDDELVLLPFEGMLSIVAPHYGVNLRSVSDLTVHQFQQGGWVLCSAGSVAKHITIVSPVSDLR